MTQNRPYGAMAVGLAVAITLSACFGGNQPAQGGGPEQQQAASPTAPAGVAVTVQNASRGNLQASLSYTGDVRAKAQVSIVPRVSSSRIEEMRVDIGSEVKAGDIVAVLDRATLQASVRSAQGTLQQAQARLDGLQNPRQEDIAVARANVISQQNALDKILNPPQAQIDVLRAQLANAEADLKSAQSAYDRIAFEPDAGRRPEAVALEKATNAYNVALSNLNNLLSAPQQDIDRARQAIETAEQQLRRAMSPSASDLSSARGQIVSAQAGLETANANLAEATVRAPIDGIVADRPSPVGSTIGASTPIVTLVSKDVEVIIPVEETRLSDIAVGSEAVLTVSAYPGEEIPARVISISPVVDQRSRTVSVRVEPNSQDGRLRQGMFAQIRLIARERQGVVLVPRDAVVQRDGQNVVFTVTEGRARQVRIEIGASDDRNTEVRSGLNVGQPVIVGPSATLRDGDAVTPRTTPGGGAPGGGGGAPGGGGGAPGGGQGSATPPAGTPRAQATPTVVR